MTSSTPTDRAWNIETNVSRANFSSLQTVSYHLHVFRKCLLESFEFSIFAFYFQPPFSARPNKIVRGSLGCLSVIKVRTRGRLNRSWNRSRTGRFAGIVFQSRSCLKLPVNLPANEG